MKKFLLAFLMLAGVAYTFAQDSTTVDTKKLKKRNDLDKKFVKFSKDRFALDLLAANWIYNPSGDRFNGLRTRWFSRGLDFKFFWDFRFKHSRVSIAPGIGYSIYTINSRHSLVENDTTGVSFSPITNENIKVNSITLQYLEIPIELRIRTNPDKFNNMWKVAIGVKGGVRIDVHTKQKIEEVGDNHIHITSHFPEFNNFRFGPTIRVGYSIFNLTAYFGVLNVFKAERGPKATEFSFGFSINAL